MHARAALALLGLATSVFADFHIIAENGVDGNSQVVTDTTNFFVIGSSADTEEHVCSGFESGKPGRFDTDTISVGTFADGSFNCNNGTCLLSKPSFSFKGFSTVCGFNNPTFVLQSPGVWEFGENGFTTPTGQCFTAAPDSPTSCFDFPAGEKTLVGQVTDLMFCQADGISNFCDPAVTPPS